MKPYYADEQEAADKAKVAQDEPVDTRTAVQDRHATYTRRDEAEVLAVAIVAAHTVDGKVGGAS